ncbi:hypothetical protein GCM10009759_70860 [Kitasatospora saccharophila]|uniref:ParB/Spo0J HTH domain-containing protein n=1 Tax=Kitasatospora saccharophila TaxID=407973 RepID=A0ABP5JW46_9ACTN
MTRAADRLGGASSFGAVRPRSERGRAKAVAEGSIPDYELQRLPLGKVRPSLVNPRRYFGTDEEQEALGHSLARKQTTACVAVTKDAYLALWPEHEADIDNAEWIILNGERRYRSALRVKIEHLDFVIRDDLATTCADFIDYLMLENDERQDFNVIERAQGLADLLRACDGNAAEVARRRGKDRSWVGNQIALLTLPSELQDMLVAGTLAERYARRLARALKDTPSLRVEDLLAMAEGLKTEEKDRRRQAKDLLEAAKTPALPPDSTPSPRTPAQSEDRSIKAPEQHPSAAAPVPGTGSQADKEFPAPSGMLSADNIPEQRIVEAPAEENPGGELLPRSGAGPVLSADNTAVVQTAVKTTPAPLAADLVRALGPTPEEQAATLREGLNDEDFAALIEALYARV